MKRILSLAFALVMVMAVMAADKATAYFNVNPVMTCQNCENKIKTNLRYEKGVKTIATSIPDQVVTVTYDPAKTNTNNLIAAFKKIGYTATTTTAPKAAAKDATKKCSKANGSCCKKTQNSKCCGKGECAKAKKACGSKTGCKSDKGCESNKK